MESSKFDKLRGDKMEEVLDKNTFNIYSDQVSFSFDPKTINKKDIPLEKQTNIIDEDAIGKSKLIAILLALFLGRYGIHKFYLRRPGLGLVYLIFSRFEITMFFSIIDAFIYLFMSEERWRKEFGVKKRKKKKDGK